MCAVSGPRAPNSRRSVALATTSFTKLAHRWLRIRLYRFFLHCYTLYWRRTPGPERARNGLNSGPGEIAQIYLNGGLSRGHLPFMFICPLDPKFKIKFKIMAIYSSRRPNSGSNDSSVTPRTPGATGIPRTPGGWSPYHPRRPGPPIQGTEGPVWLDTVGNILAPVTDFLNGPSGLPSISEIGSDGSVGGDISQSLDIQSVIDRIKSSQLYIQAHNLFSSSPNYSLFLQRLQGILDSVNSNYKTWLDKIGASTDYQDSLTEAYNYAIEQIQLLLKEFHEWYNSLPSTQTDQFADAGVNSAITGQGLTGSSLNGQTAQRNFVESTNPMEVLSSISDIALNKIPAVVSTVSGVWKSIKDVRLAGRSQDLAERVQGFNEQSTLASIRKSLIEQGFSLGDEEWSSLADFHTWTQKISQDPKLSKMFKDSSVGQLFSDLSYHGIMSTVGSHPDTWTEQVFGKTFEEFYNDLGNFQLSTYMNNLEYTSRLSKYNRDYISVRNGQKAGNLQNLTDEMNSFKNNFEKQFYNQKLQFINSWIQRIQKSKDPVAKFALSKVLFNDNLVSGLDLGSEALNNVIDEFKASGKKGFNSPVGIGTNLGF